MMDINDSRELEQMRWDAEHPEPEEYTDRVLNAFKVINDICCSLINIYNMGNNQCSDELRDFADALKLLADEFDELDVWRQNGFKGD